MALPIKTYWAQLARTCYEMNRFLSKHQATLLAVVNIVSPGDTAAVEAAFAAIISATALFLRIHHLVDPNAAPSE